MNAPVARFTTAQLVAQLVALVTTAAADLRGWCEIAPTRQAAAMLAAAAMLWRRVVSNPSTPSSYNDLDADERAALAWCEEQGCLLRCDVAGECLDPPDIIEPDPSRDARVTNAAIRSQTIQLLGAIKRAWVITPEGEALASAWHEAAKLHAPQLTDAQRAALFAPYREAHPELPPPPPSKPPRVGRPFSDVDALLLDLRERLALTEEDPVKLTVRVEGRHVRARVSFPKLSNGSGACAWRYQGESAAGSAAHALREVQAMLPAAVEVG